MYMSVLSTAETDAHRTNPDFQQLNAQDFMALNPA